MTAQGFEVIPPDVREEIFARLQGAEQEHEVRILFAIESGSRAWGFASPNSDYDVRFIYARPRSWYAAVDAEERRDVIEYPITDDIDLNGWDVRKALRLFWKCNPAFVEWIQSPISYIEAGGFRQSALGLLPTVYVAERGVHHYFSMAKTTYLGHLRGEQVSLKKYLYVLRALLAIRWIEHHRAAPPIEFRILLKMIATEEGLMEEVSRLLQAKSTALELGLASPIQRLNQFIEAELARLNELPTTPAPASSVLPVLNDLLARTLL
ncbi:MAG: nucleotidyltransferase domain-containing protein [Luteimonas sp.]|nr:nucleotidyltransferase domain-containing protein [Luteimonas sp.]